MKGHKRGVLVLLSVLMYTKALSLGGQQQSTVMHTRLDQVRIKSGVEDADEILNSDNSLSLLSSEKVKEEDYHDENYGDYSGSNLFTCNENEECLAFGMICWNKSCLFETEILGERVTVEQNAVENKSPTNNVGQNSVMSNKQVLNISQNSKIDEKKQHKTYELNGGQIVEKIHHSSTSESKNVEHKTVSNSFQQPIDDESNSSKSKKLHPTEVLESDKHISRLSSDKSQVKNNLETDENAKKSVSRSATQSEKKSERKIQISGPTIVNDILHELRKSEKEKNEKSYEIEKNDRTRKKLLAESEISTNQFPERKTTENSIVHKEEKDKSFLEASSIAKENRSTRLLRNKPSTEKKGDQMGVEKSDQILERSSKDIGTFAAQTDIKMSGIAERAEQNNVKTPQEDSVQSKIDSLLQQLKETNDKILEIDKNKKARNESTHNSSQIKKQNKEIRKHNKDTVGDDVTELENNTLVSQKNNKESIKLQEDQAHEKLINESALQDTELQDKAPEVIYKSSKTKSKYENEKEISSPKKDHPLQKTTFQKVNKNDKAKIPENESKKKKEPQPEKLLIRDNSSILTTEPIMLNKDFKKSKDELEHSLKKLDDHLEQLVKRKELKPLSANKQKSDKLEKESINLKANKETKEKDKNKGFPLDNENQNKHFENKSLSQKRSDRTSTINLKEKEAPDKDEDSNALKPVNINDEHMPLSKTNTRKATGVESNDEHVEHALTFKNMTSLKNSEGKANNKDFNNTDIKAAARPNELEQDWRNKANILLHQLESNTTVDKSKTSKNKTFLNNSAIIETSKKDTSAKKSCHTVIISGSYNTKQTIKTSECIPECLDQIPALPYGLVSGFASSLSDSGNVVFCGGHKMGIKSERSCQESKLMLDDSSDTNGTWNRMCWLHETGSTSWKKIATLPVGISGSAVTTLNLNQSLEMLVVMGGFTPGSTLDMPSTKLQPEIDENSNGYSDKILIWITGSKEWTSDPVETRLPYALSGACAVTFHNKIYLTGGHNQNSVHRLVLEYAYGKEIKQIGSLQTSRTGHGCAIVHVNFVPHLVVAGGRSIGPQEMPLMLRSVEAVRINSDHPEPFEYWPSMAGPRVGFALVSFNEHTLRAIGGKSLDEEGKLPFELPQVEEMDTSAHSSSNKWNWLILPKIRMKNARSHFGFTRCEESSDLAIKRSRRSLSATKKIDNKSYETDRNNFAEKQEFQKSSLSHKFHPLEYSSTESLENENYKIVEQENQDSDADYFYSGVETPKVEIQNKNTKQNIIQHEENQLSQTVLKPNASEPIKHGHKSQSIDAKSKAIEPPEAKDPNNNQTQNITKNEEMKTNATEPIKHGHKYQSRDAESKAIEIAETRDPNNNQTQNIIENKEVQFSQNLLKPNAIQPKKHGLKYQSMDVESREVDVLEKLETSNLGSIQKLISKQQIIEQVQGASGNTHVDIINRDKMLSQHNHKERNSTQKRDQVVYLAGGLGSSGQTLTKSIWKVEKAKVEKLDMKLPVALRSIFGGFLSGHFVICGGIKSNYEPLVSSGSGPEDEDECYYGKPEVGSWRHLLKLPVKLSSPTTFVTTTFGKMMDSGSEVLFVVGGLARGKNGQESYQSDAMTIVLENGKPIVTYNLKFLKHARAGAATVFFKGRYVVTIGGHNDTNVLSSVEIIDVFSLKRFHEDVWPLNSYHTTVYQMTLSDVGQVKSLKKMSQMRVGRSSHGCAVFNSRKSKNKYLVVAGGIHFSLDGILYLSSVEILDLTSHGSKWKSAKPLNKARAGFALISNSQGIISAIGGWPISEVDQIEKNSDLVGAADWTRKKFCSCKSESRAFGTLIQIPRDNSKFSFNVLVKNDSCQNSCLGPSKLSAMAVKMSQEKSIDENKNENVKFGTYLNQLTGTEAATSSSLTKSSTIFSTQNVTENLIRGQNVSQSYDVDSIIDLLTDQPIP